MGDRLAGLLARTARNALGVVLAGAAIWGVSVQFRHWRAQPPLTDAAPLQVRPQLQLQHQHQEQLLAAQSGLTQLQHQYSEAAMWEAPLIRQQVRAIQGELGQPGGLGAAAAAAGIAQLGRQLADASAGAGYLGDVQAAVSKLQKMDLSAADRERVAALQRAAGTAAVRLDAAQVKALAADAEALLNFAILPLSIQVADRLGALSAVERNDIGSGGKSWYLIVEALDAEGHAMPVPLPVGSAGRGAGSWARLWGVRVSREEYQKVKEARQSGGRESRAMGGKAAHTLTVRYARTLKAQPDMITAW